MRDAKALDYWSKLLSRKHAEFLQLTIEKHPLFVPQDIDLSPGVIALCGPNGVGKTRLVGLITTLCSNEPLPPDINASLTVAATGKPRTPYGARERVPKPEVIHPVNLVDVLDGLIGDKSDLSEFLSQYEPVSLSDQFYQDVRRALGRGYESVQIYDLSDLTNDESPLPYIRVEDNGMSYDVFDMGSGETAAFYLLWRVHAASRDSLLVIEEPETYLSPSTQRHVLDIIARQSVFNQFVVIVTSHSPEMFRRLPLENVRMLTRTRKGVLVNVPKRHSDLRDSVGLDIHKQGVILVEDDSAKAFVESILGVLEYQMAKEYVVSIAQDGDGHIVKAMEFPAATFKNLHQVGVLDGDMRSKCKPPPGIFFLPTDVSPDHVAWEEIASEVDEIVRHFSVSEDRVEAAIVASRSLDIHDRLRATAKKLDLNADHLRDWAFRSWLKKDANTKTASDLLAAIADYVSRLDPA